MQPTNKPKQQQSRCMYCGSTTRGKGCRYAPHGVHFHPDDPTKCAYCGSPNYGKGCHVNPIGDIHVHGVNYNSMFKEQLQGFINAEFLLKELTKKFEDFEAFKHGIIDANGNKLRTPVNEEEELAYSPFVKTILKLKRFLGTKTDLLEAGMMLENKSLSSKNTDYVHQQKLFECKTKVQENLNNLYKTIDEAMLDGITFDEVKELINV